MDLIIKNGLVVSPTGIAPAAVAVDKGKIVAVGQEEYMPSADRTIDAAGKHILPGVCDLHCHEDHTPSPPYASWATIARTESEAAALGGVTTMGFYIRQAADESTADIFPGKRSDWDGNAVGDCIFHSLVVHDDRKDEIPRCISEFGITTFKFLAGYKGAQADKIGSVVVDDGFVFDGFQRIAELRRQGSSALPLVHAENPDIIPYLRKKVEGRYDHLAWHDSRPNFVEAECMSRLIYLADVARCPVYIVHVTIAEGVDIVARARYEGKEVIGETCPQYLTHNHENAPALMRDKPVFTVVNPPIRHKEDNERLWRGIKDGTITVLGSDSTPIKSSLKDVDMWGKGFVPMGLGPNNAMILPVLLSEGVNKRGLSLERVVEVSSYNPARVFGLYPQKGTISPGSDADLVIVDLNKEVTWKQAMSPSNADWSIYEDWHFKGWPALTMVRGKTIMQDGRIVADPGWGRYVYRK